MPAAPVRFDANGLPEQIDATYMRRRYGQNFPTLLQDSYSELLESAIEDTYAMFKGVAELWARLDQKTYFRKTQMCYGLLVAWYITDVYPQYTIGVASTGGIPLASKSIGGVKVSFMESMKQTGGRVDLLSALKSNSFGNKAYLMIRGSSKIIGLK